MLSIFFTNIILGFILFFVFYQDPQELGDVIANNDASTAAKAAFTELDESAPNVLLTISDANDGHELFDRFAEFIGVDTKNVPAVLYMGGKSNKYFFDKELK